MTLPPEEQARADLYALLARLFYAPADAALLRSIAEAGEMQAEDESLARHWRQLAAAAAASTLAMEAVREEYETAFGGPGKAPVTLYSSAYTIRYSNEVPLSELRGDLAAFGLARRPDAGEPEDHIAALCDVMRHLIAKQQIGLEEQRRFFRRWIARAADPLCDAIIASPATSFYKHVARFAKAYFALEQSAFEML